jgi:hypothetical protein
MRAQSQPFCPECEDIDRGDAGLDRRQFIRVVGEKTTAALAFAGVATIPAVARADDTPAVAAKKPAKPAEALVRELFAGLSDEQKKQVVLPYDHGAPKGLPTRMGMYNAPIAGKKIGTHFTKPQQELIERTLRAIASDEDGFRRITRNGTYDASGALENCGALIFGDPSGDRPFAWVFSGHHLTVRCDGNFTDGTAFGGPMYYGHSPDGYSDENVFHYQTKSVLSVFDALDEAQRKKAVVKGTPGEQMGSVKLRPAAQTKPGINIGELTRDQRGLVEKVMRDILSPYRKEDADEVIQVIKQTGGMEKVSLAFYQDREMNDAERWHFWRLEGPGFVWNYRVLPHVHTYVNIGSKV